PVLVLHLQHRAVDGDAGVVDQDVETAVRFDDLVDGASAVVGVRDVAAVHRVADVLATGLVQVCEELIRLGGVASVACGDGGALARQAAADRRTDAACAAGDEGAAAAGFVSAG